MQFVSDNKQFTWELILHRVSKQELSYRKQIARQLRTQYVEGIYDNPVTLKSRLSSLKVTGNGTIRYISYRTYY